MRQVLLICGSFGTAHHGRSYTYCLLDGETRVTQEPAMFRLLWMISVHSRYFLRRHMPTNRLLDAIRTRRGLKWGIPMMLLAAPYLLIADICITLIADGGPGWLHVVVLWSIWNAMKFIIMGPTSLVLLVRALVQEAVARRRARNGQVTSDRSVRQASELAGTLR